MKGTTVPEAIDRINLLKEYWSASNNSHIMHLQFSESLSSEATHEFGHKLGINDEGDIELAPSYLIYGKQYIRVFEETKR